MSVAIRADRKGDHARIVPTGPFGLAHATTAARAVENAEALLAGCGSVDVDLAQLDRIDGTGAVLLARLLDRLDADGRRASIIEASNDKAARLIARYRERRTDLPAPRTRAMSLLTRIGALAAHLPGSCLHSAAFDPGWRRAGPRRRFGGHDCYYAYDSACLCRGDLEYTAARPLCHNVTVIMA